MTTQENTSSSIVRCTGCRFLKQKCNDECIFAPLFPQNDSEKFKNLASVYGVSNVSKLLVTIPELYRKDAVTSLHEEAKYMIKDPVYGCMKHINDLQNTLKAKELALHNARKELSAYSAQPISRNKDLGNLSSDTEASLPGSQQPQQPQPPRKMAKGKGKKVASAANKGKLVIGNSSQLLRENSQPMIGVSAGMASVHTPPQPKRPRQIAKDKGKQGASAAHEGKLVIGNYPQLMSHNSQSMIGVSTGEASEHSPPQPKRPRKMAKDKGKQVKSAAYEGKLVLENRPQLLSDNSQPMIAVSFGVASVHSPPQPQTPQKKAKDKGKQGASAAHEGKLVIGSRPRLLPGQQQVRQMAPIAVANRDRLIIRDPQTHEYLADQQQFSGVSLIDQMTWADMYQLLTTADQHQLGQISTVNTGQMQIREPQPDGYIRLDDQQQMSSADTGHWLSREPKQHGYTRMSHQQQLGQTSSVNTGQMLIREPQPNGYMRVHDQHQMANMSSADMGQLVTRELQQHEFTRIADQQQLGRTSSADTGQMLIMKPQPDGVIRIDDQQQMAQMSPADTGPVLSREPQQHGFTRFNTVFHEQQYSLLQSQQLMQQNQQPYFSPDYQHTALNWQMTLQRQQNQQLQQNQQPDFPPNCQMALIVLFFISRSEGGCRIPTCNELQLHPMNSYSAMDSDPESTQEIDVSPLFSWGGNYAFHFQSYQNSCFYLHKKKLNRKPVFS